MNLYDRDYNALSVEDEAILNKIRRVQSRRKGPTTFTLETLALYTNSLWKYLDVFPNNMLIVDPAKMSKDIGVFSDLIDDPNATERRLLNFIKSEQAYEIVASITEAYDFGHHGIYVFPEFPLGQSYRADFLVVGKNSQGCHFLFIEFESVYGNVTLAGGEFGEVIRKGLLQTRSWASWLEGNFSMLEDVFRKQLNKLKELPEDFRKYDSTRLHYVVVAGRRANYNKLTQREARRTLKESQIRVMHYDNLIERAHTMLMYNQYKLV